MNTLQTNQTIYVDNRKVIKITDVIKVLEINPKEACVDTSLGKIIILGDNLEIKQYDIDKGLLIIVGTINSFEYIIKEKKKEKGFFQKLFQ